jgi:LAO/AO transport system kinase
VGVVGRSGAGKSTLTDELVMCMRDEDLDVGVLAVDPSSPFSGGAILGDRVRMQRHSTDPGVFIRSMASRGHLGGLALATPQAVRVLDAVGKEWVIVETVGVGQVEVEIASQADTTIVVVNPGWGDEVQAAKAGLLEIADIFVVNKADRPGADVTVSDLAGMLELGRRKAWLPPIVRTIATTGDGLAELWDEIGAHRAFLEADGAVVERRRARLVDEIRGLVAERLLERAGAISEGRQFEALVDKVAARTSDPYTAVDTLLGE